MTSTLVTSAPSVLVHSQRYWVRRTSPVPFVWAGLWPVLGLLLLALYALWPFAQGEIEANVAQHTRAALDSKGQAWAKMEVSGQDVRLTGIPPQAQSGDEALAVARDAECPTWAGGLICPVSVTGDFGPPVPPLVTPVAAAPVPPLHACEVAMADVVAKSGIEFATGSATLVPESDAVLNALAVAAKSCPKTIQVQGYTDSVGNAEQNQLLSVARAQAVRQALMDRGLPATSLVVRGFGEEHPQAANDTEEGRARNRRIEFRLVNDN